MALAKIYELVNTLGGALANEKALLAADGTAAAALSEATSLLVRMMAPMTPHLAEESWAALGHDGLVAHADWPVVDRSLLVEDEVTMPVQVNGKKRADVTVARAASPAEVEAEVLKLEAVIKALDGKSPKKVIVVAQRIVNVVV